MVQLGLGTQIGSGIKSFTMYGFVREMHLNKNKSLKRIVQSVPKWNSTEKILSRLLMDSLADSGGFIHHVAASKVRQQCRSTY